MELIERVFDSVCWFKRPQFSDNRGDFSRLFCAEQMSQYQQDSAAVQINFASNHKALTLRGMHYQLPPAAESKTIACIAGRVFDVVVDLRRDSKTFLQWHSFELNANEPTSLVIPAGFAHGYLTLEENSQLIYCHSHAYQPELEAALSYADPRLQIAWPEQPAVISERDLNHPKLTDDFKGLSV